MEYEYLLATISNGFKKLSGLYKTRRDETTLETDLKKDIFNVLPEEKDIGEIIVKSYNEVLAKLDEIEKKWLEDITEFQYGVEEAWGRVIESAKQDIADEKREEEIDELVDDGMDRTEAEAEVEEIDPDNISEQDVFKHFGPEEMWQWWGEEWGHNIKGRFPIARYVDHLDFSYDKFRRYENSIPDLFDRIIATRLQDEVEQSVANVKDAVQRTIAMLQEQAFDLLSSIFTNKQFFLKIKT